MDTLSFLTPLYEGRVAILTSDTTASSAEIFSRTLQHYRRAIVVGQTTAGVVLGGFNRPLPGGGYMNVTELDFRGADGQRLEGGGVKPDVAVEPTLADLRAGRDPVRDAAGGLAAASGGRCQREG